MKLEDRIIAIIKEDSEESEEISETADLESDLGIDSFGILMIINGIEDAYNITIEEDTFEGIRTVRDIARALRAKYEITE